MIIFVVFLILVVCFSFVLTRGAPYLPTQKKQAEAGLDLLNLRQDQTLYELGCGDGRVLRRAAARGLKCVGYELNPLLYVVARVVTWKYRKNVRIVFGDFWAADLSGADGVFVFLLDKFMTRFDKKMQSAGKPLPVVSYAFEIPGKKPAGTRDGIFLYQY